MLTPGSRIGAYEIVGSLGAGGMGEVYRARDTKLGRDVAIKVLPETIAHDADRVARFTREAKTLASLTSNDFMNQVASISLHEAERGSEIGGGWDPLGHTPGDVFTAYNDEDFRLGLNAAQTTLGAVAQLVGARGLLGRDLVYRAVPLNMTRLRRKLVRFAGGSAS